MFDPIFKLAVVALRQSPGYLVCAAGSILAARGWPIIHTLADTKSVIWHRGPTFCARARGLPDRVTAAFRRRACQQHSILSRESAAARRSRNAKAAGSDCAGSAATGFTGCCWRCAVVSRSSQSQRARSPVKISSAEQPAKHLNRTVSLPFLTSPPCGPYDGTSQLKRRVSTLGHSEPDIRSSERLRETPPSNGHLGAGDIRCAGAPPSSVTPSCHASTARDLTPNPFTAFVMSERHCPAPKEPDNDWPDLRRFKRFQSTFAMPDRGELRRQA